MIFQLTEVLSKISRETNPLKREQLQAQAELLASGGVIKVSPNVVGPVLSKPVIRTPTIEDSVMSILSEDESQGRQELTTTLDWARNSLDEESAEVLSADLESDDIAKSESFPSVVTYMRENGITTLKKSR